MLGSISPFALVLAANVLILSIGMGHFLVRFWLRLRDRGVLFTFYPDKTINLRPHSIEIMCMYILSSIWVIPVAAGVFQESMDPIATWGVMLAWGGALFIVVKFFRRKFRFRRNTALIRRLHLRNLSERTIDKFMGWYETEQDPCPVITPAPIYQWENRNSGKIPSHLDIPEWTLADDGYFRLPGSASNDWFTSYPHLARADNRAFIVPIGSVKARLSEETWSTKIDYMYFDDDFAVTFSWFRGMENPVDIFNTGRSSCYGVRNEEIPEGLRLIGADQNAPRTPTQGVLPPPAIVALSQALIEAWPVWNSSSNHSKSQNQADARSDISEIYLDTPPITIGKEKALVLPNNIKEMILKEDVYILDEDKDGVFTILVSPFSPSNWRSTRLKRHKGVV